MSEQVVDAEVLVDSDTGQELVPASSSTSLFRTDDPVQVLERAKGVADALAPVIRQAGLVATISGKDYLTVEAWQTLGQQVGVTPVVTSTRRLANPDGWEATCEARTLDGRVIGAAESMCLRTEERWEKAEDFEIRSMAQTRAMSRALASVLRFIPTLAGFSGTPAEEMQGRRQTRSEGSDVPSPKQLDFLVALLKQNGVSAQNQELVRAWGAKNLTGGKEGTASRAITALKSNDVAQIAEAQEWLLSKAGLWAASQTDVPADDSGLPSEPVETGGEIG